MTQLAKDNRIAVIDNGTFHGRVGVVLITPVDDRVRVRLDGGASRGQQFPVQSLVKTGETHVAPFVYPAMMHSNYAAAVLQIGQTVL